MQELELIDLSDRDSEINVKMINDSNLCTGGILHTVA